MDGQTDKLLEQIFSDHKKEKEIKKNMNIKKIQNVYIYVFCSMTDRLTKRRIENYKSVDSSHATLSVSYSGRTDISNYRVL